MSRDTLCKAYGHSWTEDRVLCLYCGKVRKMKYAGMVVDEHDIVHLRAFNGANYGKCGKHLVVTVKKRAVTCLLCLTSVVR